MKKSNPLPVHLMIHGQNLHTKIVLKNCANMSPMMLNEIKALIHWVGWPTLFHMCEDGSDIFEPHCIGYETCCGQWAP